MNQNQIRVFKDTKKRANEFAAYTAPDGTSYPWVPRDLLEVVDLPQPPSDFSDETYFRTEQDAAPYVVYTRKPDGMIAQARQAEANAKALAYLASTDWYVTRQAEVGTAIPADVLTKRQEARNAIHPTGPAVPAGSAVQAEQVVVAGDNTSAAP